jgi:hypothetical protein
MKVPALLASIVTVLALGLPLRADALPPPTPWNVIWFPWNATYASWDWTGDGPSITVEPSDVDHFPASVKTWSLAVCSAKDPSRKTLVPLENPLVSDPNGSRGLDLALWTPGRIPVSELDEMGEGTFLCAVVGDGQRYSNVSRVTINRSYQRTALPGVSVVALPFPDPDVRQLAVRVVPGPDDHLDMFDLVYPSFSINGSWSRPRMLSWKGTNSILQPGKSYVRIVKLDKYDPPIAPFNKAEVQVKIVEDYPKAEAAFPPGLAGDPATAVKTWLAGQKGPTSPVRTLTATEIDAINFDTAFDLK